MGDKVKIGTFVELKMCFQGNFLSDRLWSMDIGTTQQREFCPGKANLFKKETVLFFKISTTQLTLPSLPDYGIAAFPQVRNL